jgi:predicted amidohydrolase YtcJ
MTGLPRGRAGHEGHVERRRGAVADDRRGPPDRILVARTVWTAVGPGLHPLNRAAVSIRGDRIAEIGPAEEVLRTRGPSTVVHELGDGAILPGFVDAHVHLQGGGLELFRVELRGATSPDEFMLRVGERARTLPEGSWVLGGGWDHHLWGGELPHRAWLDRVAPRHPVLLVRADMHVAVANSEALRRAGLDDSTPDPDGGRMHRDPDTGALTGILEEHAMEPVSAVIPPPGPADREAALRAAMRLALRNGITQVHDMGALQSPDESWASVETLRALHARGAVPIRVSAAVPLSERLRLAEWVAEVGGGDERLRWGSVKAFVDGSMGAETAWLLDDYLGRPGHRGGPCSDLDELRLGLEEATALGLQTIVHAIGDAASSWLLDVFEGIRARFPGRDLRFRLEHAQHLDPALLPRLAHPAIVCSMQPAHLLDDGRWAGALLGPERERWAYPVRSLLEHGARVAFGSDWTVSPLDPRVGLAAAVSRTVRAVDGSERVWIPEERIDLARALRAQTLDAARAAFLDGETGSIEPGKRADLVLLDRSPFELPPEALPTDLQVKATLVDGALAWQDRDEPGIGGAP